MMAGPGRAGPGRAGPDAAGVCVNYKHDLGWLLAEAPPLAAVPLAVLYQVGLRARTHTLACSRTHARARWCALPHTLIHCVRGVLHKVGPRTIRARPRFCGGDSESRPESEAVIRGPRP